MLRAKKKGPKLRTKGGVTRGLIAFGAQLAQEHFEKLQNERSHALMRTFALFLDFYMFVSDRPYNAEMAATSCRQFLLLYKSLGGVEVQLWAIKPTFHMLQEMTEYQAVDMDMSPADFWAY